MPRKTFIAGSPLLANEVNTFLMTQAVQTYADAAARTTALPTPTEGQIVYLNDVNIYQASHGGALWYPVAGQMPYIELTKTASQNFTSGTTAIVTWAAPTIQRGGFTVLSNVVTVPTTGIYQIVASIYWTGNATGNRLLKIMKNGADYTRDGQLPPGALSYTPTSVVQLFLNSGDTISVEGFQASGGTLAALADLTRLTIRYVCP